MIAPDDFFWECWSAWYGKLYQYGSCWLILGGIVVDFKVEKPVKLGFVKLTEGGAAFSDEICSRVWEVRH